MFQAANKKVIELQEDASITAVTTMFKHLYGQNYEKQEMPTHITDLVGFHLEVYMLGDKYDISALRIEAAERFFHTVDDQMNQSLAFGPTDATVYAIRRLLGPHAVQLAVQTLTMSIKGLVLSRSTDFFRNTTFRKLLGTGTMLDIELGVEFLDKIYAEWIPSGLF